MNRDEKGLLGWVINNLLNESQLDVIPPGYDKPLRGLTPPPEPALAEDVDVGKVIAGLDQMILEAGESVTAGEGVLREWSRSYDDKALKVHKDAIEHGKERIAFYKSVRFLLSRLQQQDRPNENWFIPCKTCRSVPIIPATSRCERCTRNFMKVFDNV